MADFIKKVEDKILEAEVRHDERVIEKKREDLNEHVVEEGYDKTGLMKDLRKDEISHDEKVIARKEADAAKHDEKIKSNEQAICGCGCDKK